jgi:hypothetical protein
MGSTGAAQWRTERARKGAAHAKRRGRAKETLRRRLGDHGEVLSEDQDLVWDLRMDELRVRGRVVEQGEVGKREDEGVRVGKRRRRERN